MLTGIKKLFAINNTAEKEVDEAYNVWARTYDAQPGNLMLDLDERLFTKLLNHTDLANKKVADIGCGTGRHWPKLWRQRPRSLTGFDVSAGMLTRLKEKYNAAETYLITDNLFEKVPTNAFDVIISTLTVAHISNLEEALLAWCRILKPGGEIIITDFHPAMLAAGGRRTFKYGDKYIVVRNFVHHINFINGILSSRQFRLLRRHEININEDVKHYYAQQGALAVYEQFAGMPVIYGLHFKHDAYTK